MNPGTLIETLPEAMGDVPGICELPLTRAIVQYRDVHEMDTPGGRIEDIGLALVVEGKYASSAEVLELGSGKVKTLDLSTELVILDWAYEPTLAHVNNLLRESASGLEGGPLRQYAFRLALLLLERIGFGPLTRPTFLRIGFRDICRDLDLHEGTSIRVMLGPGRLTRIHLDYDACALRFRTAFHEQDPQLEHALVEGFRGGEVRRLVPSSPTEALEYQVRYPLPESLADARTNLAAMRRGILSLMARFEPHRFETLDSVLDTFGNRETLAGLRVRDPNVQAFPVSVQEVTSVTVH